MAKLRLHRRDLGLKFSEGARLTWLAMERKGLDQAALARLINKPPSAINRVLYGDKLPGLDLATGLERVLKVRCFMWFEAPRNNFIPPAARSAA